MERLRAPLHPAIQTTLSISDQLKAYKVYPSLKNACVLRPEVIGEGVDILCMRELSGDIYFGEHRIEEKQGVKIALDLMTYDATTIAHIAHAAFKAARRRGKKVTSVDKANVLACSRLWREVVSESPGNTRTASWNICW